MSDKKEQTNLKQCVTEMTYHKKASIQLSTETVVKVVLTVFLLLALFYVSGKLLGVFTTDKDESTIRNFEQLAATIAQMEEGASVSSYPIYIAEDYAVVGYQSGVDEIGTQGAIEGSCTPYDITSPSLNKKPEKCGAGEEGCLCLCKKTDDFATLCQENDKVIMCKTSEYFQADLSFTGELQRCMIGLLYGSETPQTIYINKHKDSVSFGIAVLQIVDGKEVLQEGGSFSLQYLLSGALIQTYDLTVTYNKETKKYIFEQTSAWKRYRPVPEGVYEYETYSDVLDAIEEIFISKDVSASKLTLIATSTTQTLSETYTTETLSDLRVHFAGSEETHSSTESSSEKITTSESSSPQNSGTSVLILGDSQTMGTYGDELYSSFKSDGYATNMYAVCGATPSYFTKGSSILSCGAEYTYNDGTSDYVTSGNTPLIDDLILEHNPTLVFVTF
ncbi:MAG: hypothetical protein AABX82_02870, partial [Nanoarchaeota archaeon]